METQNKVFVNRAFNCSASQLFQWLIDPTLIPLWFGPKQFSIGAVKTDVRVGGKYTIELQKPGSDNFFIEGEYTEIDAPYKVVFTLRYTGVPAGPPKSMVKIVLEDVAPNQSSLSLTQHFEFTPMDMAERTKAWEHMLELLSNKF